jgi:hypothetical protein
MADDNDTLLKQSILKLRNPELRPRNPENAEPGFLVTVGFQNRGFRITQHRTGC